MAVDKERFIRTIKGLGEVADGGLFSPLSPYYQAGLAYPFDPDGAQALLAEAGFADGFDVTFWSGDFTPYKEMGQVGDSRILGRSGSTSTSRSRSARIGSRPS